MTEADRLALHRLAEALAPGTGVMVPREWLLELLEGTGEHPSEGSPVPPADLTVAQVASRYGRHASTVRVWLERGAFPGAYKLRGRDWRVPAADLAAFDASERAREAGTPAARRGPRKAADLGAWRRAG